MNNYKTEIVLHTTSGATMTLKSMEALDSISQKLCAGDKRENRVAIVDLDLGSRAFINTQNVCCVVLNGLGGKNGQ